MVIRAGYRFWAGSATQFRVPMELQSEPSHNPEVRGNAETTERENAPTKITIFHLRVSLFFLFFGGEGEQGKEERQCVIGGLSFFQAFKRIFLVHF